MREKSRPRSANPRVTHLSSRSTLALLRRYESRNVTHVEPDGSWPIVWERARGVHVWDAEGRKYLDLTAAFGVAAAGHANPNVVRAGQRQMGRLLHAMGDVHPHALKAELARELSRLTFERWTDVCQNRLTPSLSVKEAESNPNPYAPDVPELRSGAPASGTARSGKLTGAVPEAGAPAQGRGVSAPGNPATTGKTIFCNSGFEAVEAALKTALLATGRAGVLAFTGGYHGLGYGALTATHRDYFRLPFRAQLKQFARFAPFPARADDLPRVKAALNNAFRRGDIGVVLVEPVQARGGIHVPPREFLPVLRALCDRHGALLVLDEIYTGFGRTGRWFACEHSGVTPDLICLGKALTGGFPLSACVGRADLMDAAWPLSPGEALHTSTFLGHPVGCAMALANLREIDRLQLPGRAGRLGALLLDELAVQLQPRKLRAAARGLGLMAGVELRRRNSTPAGSETFRVIQEMLRRGFVLLPEGAHGNVIGFTPPLTITGTRLREAVCVFGEVLRGL
jgi:4-aminobutyrate aminotransferase-like enzyme